MRYFRQALAMMREERLFSGIYIVGTALAIAFTMVIAVVYYAKLADIAPEVNRSRTVYVKGMAKRAVNDTLRWEPTSYTATQVKEWLYTLKSAEVVSATVNASRYTSDRQYLKCDNHKLVPVVTRMVDANFFKVYQFRFVYGRPFTQEECLNENYYIENAAVPAVISRDIAEQAFGKDVDPVGKTLNYGFLIRIVGVIEPTSSIMEESFGQLFLALDQEAERVIVVLKEGCTVKDLEKELAEIARKRSVSDKEYDYSIISTLLPHAQMKMSEDGVALPWSSVFKSLFPKVFVLLLVPALNLSGLVAARMRRRVAEMGVRKAFGAKRRTLLTQVIAENLVLTLCGGFVGLVITWLLLYVFRSWLFFAVGNTAFTLPEPTVDGEMLFSPLIFVIGLAVCIVLNLMAALIPAWISLRNPIVESMNEKK
ncbi:MAG: ABC transporter permease [Bacteroidaceae bacterium]|nr:ABC transporter permease [Bacteroidaceae bacterium]